MSMRLSTNGKREMIMRPDPRAALTTSDESSACARHLWYHRPCARPPSRALVNSAIPSLSIHTSCRQTTSHGQPLDVEPGGDASSGVLEPLEDVDDRAFSPARIAPIARIRAGRSAETYLSPLSPSASV